MKKHTKLSLFSLSPPFLSNNIIFIPLSNFGKDSPRQQQSQKSLFLNISTRNLPSLSLCGTILLSLDLLDFQALFHLLSLPLSCSKSNDWAVPHVLLQQSTTVQMLLLSGCVATQRHSQVSPRVWSPRAELHTHVPGPGQSWHRHRTHGCSHALSQQIPRRITKGEESQPSPTLKSLSQGSPACTSMTETSLLTI